MSVSNFSIVEKTRRRDPIRKRLAHQAGDDRAEAAPQDPDPHRQQLPREAGARPRAEDDGESYLQYGGISGEWSVAGSATDIPVQPFTTDKSLIHAAFDRVNDMPVCAAYHEIDSFHPFRPHPEGSRLRAPTTITAKRFVSVSREQTFRNLMTLQNTARAVAEMAQSYSADEGKKFMILVPAEWRTTPLHGVRQSDRPADGAVAVGNGKVIDGMVREANAANFTIHVVNARARGMQAPQHDVENRSRESTRRRISIRTAAGTIPSTPPTSTPSLSPSLWAPAACTCPRTTSPNRFSAIDTQTANFYSLGYYAANTTATASTTPSRSGEAAGRARSPTASATTTCLRTTASRRVAAARLTFDHVLGPLPVTLNLGSRIERPQRSDRPSGAGRSADGQSDAASARRRYSSDAFTSISLCSTTKDATSDSITNAGSHDDERSRKELPIRSATA